MGVNWAMGDSDGERESVWMFLIEDVFYVWKDTTCALNNNYVPCKYKYTCDGIFAKHKTKLTHS